MDWNARYEADDTPWEKGAPAPPLAEYLTRHSISGRVLVPGCGSGHDCRLLAAHGAEVVGMDIAPRAIEQARTHQNIGGESYLAQDFFQLPRRFQQHFDWIVEHTCFCAIDPRLRTAYVAACQQALKPSGRLFAIFFRNPDHTEDGPPYGCTPEELDQLFGGSFTLKEEWVPQAAYAGREGRELVRIYQREE